MAHDDIYITIKSKIDLTWYWHSFSLMKDIGIKMLKSKFDEIKKEIPVVEDYIRAGVIEVKDLVKGS